jgi:predicted RNA-binding Zn ribbon-like protein
VFEWAIAARLLNGDGHINRDQHDAAQFAAAVHLREDLYGVFGPVARRESPGAAALDAVIRRASLAARSAEWVRRGSSYEPRWPGNSIEAICDQLADAAVLLLRSSSVARIGSCAGCGWLFLDTSRGHARRWCSMNVCGVRDKMRRYHQRQSNATSIA